MKKRGEQCLLFDSPFLPELLFGRFFFFDAFQEDRGRFVGGFLGEEGASEGFGEYGGSNVVDILKSSSVFAFELIGERKERVDAADDFFLFGEGGERKA